MTVINKIYSVLMLGDTLPQDHKSYRYSNYTPTAKQLRALKSIVPVDINDRAIFTDFLLSLLQCSPEWADCIRNIDPVNTYSITTETPTSSQSLMLDQDTTDQPLTTLSKLSDSGLINDLDTELDRIITKLLEILK